MGKKIKWFSYNSCKFATNNRIHVFFKKQHFYKQHQAEIGKKKKEAKAKQHPEAELLAKMSK